jgi:hypothetical protein
MNGNARFVVLAKRLKKMMHVLRMKLDGGGIRRRLNVALNL